LASRDLDAKVSGRPGSRTPKFLDVAMPEHQSFLASQFHGAKVSCAVVPGHPDPLAPGSPMCQSFRISHGPGVPGFAVRIRALPPIPTPSPPSPPGEGMGASRGRPPRLPRGFRGQDRAASAPLCPLKPGIGRGRPGRSGRVIPGRNPVGSPGFAWGRRVQGLAFPGEDRGEAGEIGPGGSARPCVHSPNGERSPFGE